MVSSPFVVLVLSLSHADVYITLDRPAIWSTGKYRIHFLGLFSAPGSFHRLTLVLD